MSEIIRVPNIEKYIQEIINGELILTPKETYLTETYLTEEEFNRTILNSSKILECIVKNGEDIISNKSKYRSILDDIWSSMLTQRILQTTTFNMKLKNEEGLDGYKWSQKFKSQKFNLSIQDKDAKNTMKEIVNMIKVNNYSIKITIQLKTNLVIRFKLNV